MAKLKITEEFKAAFLAMMEQLPNITVVSRLMGISPSNIYAARKKDPKFDEDILAAVEEGYDLLENEARRRAVDGVVEPIFYKGEQISDERGNPTGVRKYSDTLLTFLLKGYRPKKFNPGAKLELATEDDITITLNLGGK